MVYFAQRYEKIAKNIKPVSSAPGAAVSDTGMAYEIIL